MRVWLVQPSEQLPLVANARRLRTRLLAEELTRRGHEVTWWASCFNHLRKEWYCPTSMRIQAEPCPRVQLLKGIGYSRNVSLRRWVDHRMLSRAFSASAAHEPPPDVVVACLPPYDLAAAAVKFAKRCGARAIVDIRDTWPDNFLGVLPRCLRGIGRIGLTSEFALRNTALAGADGLVAVTGPWLDWGLAAAGRARGPLDRVMYLGAYREPPGSVPNSIRTLVRERIANRFVVAFVGTFSTYHNPSTMIEAARLLQDRPDIIFVLMGSGDLDRQLRRQAAGLPNVEFVGWVDSPSIAEVLRNAHIGLCTAESNLATDLLPNKAFAYLSEGVPVGSAFMGELAQLIERHGFGFTFKTPADLVSHIARLSADRHAHSTMSSAATAFFSRFGDSLKIYSEFADLIEVTAGGGQSAVSKVVPVGRVTLGV